MVTFMDKVTSGRRYLHIQPSENDVDGKETKFPIRNPITSLCKSDCARGPPSLPWWSTENLKTGETLLLCNHIKMKEPPLLPITTYHVARKLDQDSRIPHPGVLSSIIDIEARGWGDCQVIFDELEVAIGQRTETFLAAFLSCWLCIFILPVRDAGCIRPGTFSVASFMASGVGYRLPIAILVSIYKGLNEISRSSHPGRGGGYFPAHFFYAWLAKNFDLYELVGEASSSAGMVKFCGIGQAKSPHASDSKRKRSDLFDTNTSKDDGKLGSKPKLKIVRSGKPLEPSFLPIGDGSSRIKIPGIDVAILATPIPAIPIQSIAPLLQDEIPIGVYEPTTKKVIELPPEGAENIMDILNSEPNPTECMVESIHRVNAPSLVPRPQCPLRAPQGGISIFNVEAVIKEVDKNAARVFGKAILDKVQGKLDEASRQLNTEGAHYEAKMVELKHVELRRQELLKELQLLEE
ncbi:hypothetical protein Cgig2_017284 [Carnegiea gigantea]|uniref:Aminotransferase-like plant mobile domain-containing protein n=1 Tax=Carnegiea gigantea TaxID=171969 RepID=A0A9Q1QIG8_9CARY|nr:hypothetical protein Cgig2_017284 [Carnegiea gigantea]